MPHACVQVWEMFFILLTSLQIFRPVSCIGLPVQYVQNIVGNKKNFKTWSMTSRKSSQRSVNQCIFISFQVGSRRLVWDGFSNDGRVPHRGNTCLQGAAFQMTLTSIHSFMLSPLKTSRRINTPNRGDTAFPFLLCY